MKKNDSLIHLRANYKLQVWIVIPLSWTQLQVIVNWYLSHKLKSDGNIKRTHFFNPRNCMFSCEQYYFTCLWNVIRNMYFYLNHELLNAGVDNFWVMNFRTMWIGYCPPASKNLLVKSSNYLMIIRVCYINLTILTT